MFIKVMYGGGINQGCEGCASELCLLILWGLEIGGVQVLVVKEIDGAGHGLHSENKEGTVMALKAFFSGENN